MSAGSTLDPDAVPGSARVRPPGHDTGSLGPSDLSDRGSDGVGPTGDDATILAEDGDSVGSGVDPSPAQADDGDAGADIGFDRVVGAVEAGLDGGLHQAEEARHGVTDEERDPVDAVGAARDPVGGRSPSPRGAWADVERVQASDDDADDAPDEGLLADSDDTAADADAVDDDAST
jgi:hypothetical protein